MLKFRYHKRHLRAEEFLILGTFWGGHEGDEPDIVKQVHLKFDNPFCWCVTIRLTNLSPTIVGMG